jgi:glycine cleavage system regulatory protein
MHQLVLFAHGFDIPGVGSAITKTLFDCNCNIENFKMTSIEGYFSLIVIFTPHDQTPSSKIEAMLLNSIDSANVEINLFTSEPPKQALKQLHEEWIPYRILITCDNRAGLLYFFMREMSKLEINIMDVRCFAVEPDIEKNSQIISKIEIPIKVSFEYVSKSLQDLARDLHVDIDIEPINDLEVE